MTDLPISNLARSTPTALPCADAATVAVMQGALRWQRAALGAADDCDPDTKAAGMNRGAYGQTKEATGKAGTSSG